MTTSKPRPLQVAELAWRIQRQLEDGIGEVSVVGEVSNARVPQSGHCYFMLKDAEAAIHAVCFRNALARCKVRPENGMQLEVRGRVSAYTPRSEYQILVTMMREAGVGDLMRRFLELQEKLKGEGLFEAALKQAIPRLPRKIGIVTSPTGAALRDILNVLERRARGLEIYLSPAAVQGEAAPGEIVRAIERLQRHAQVEVIIVGRGGGSIEDLWAFNDERVVRALAACMIPVISAVGHETDTTLCDFAADLRAPTPSAAAELVSAHYADISRDLHQMRLRLYRDARHRVAGLRARLERCRNSWGLRHPLQRLAQTIQRLDELRARLERRNPRRALPHMRERLERCRVRLENALPARWLPRLAQAQTLTGQMARRMAIAMETRARERRRELQSLANRLAAASPEAVLKRGYSIVTKGARGRVVTDPGQVKTGDTVRIQSAGGAWRAAALPSEPDLFDSLE